MAYLIQEGYPCGGPINHQPVVRDRDADGDRTRNLVQETQG